MGKKKKKKKKQNKNKQSLLDTLLAVTTLIANILAIITFIRSL